MFMIHGLIPINLNRLINFEVFNSMPSKKYKLVVHAVSHKVFEQINYRQLKNQGTLIYDVKGKINDFSDQSL